MAKKFAIFIMALLLVLPALPAYAAPGEDAAPTVTAVRGSALIYRSGGYYSTAVYRGMEIGSGDVIKTGTSSSVTVSFYKKEIVIGECTQLSLNDIWSKHDRDVTSIVLTEGTIKNRVDVELNKNSKNEIRTSNTVAGVRGTEYILIYSRMGLEDFGEENPYTRLKVIDGTVRFDLTVETSEPQIYLVEADGVKQVTENIKGVQTVSMAEIAPENLMVPLDALDSSILGTLRNDPRAQRYFDDIDAVLDERSNQGPPAPSERPRPEDGMIPASKAPDVLPTLPPPAPEQLTPAPASTPEPTPVLTQEPAPAPTPEPAPVLTPEPTPTLTPEPTPTPTPEPAPAPAPEPAPVLTPEPAPTPAPESGGGSGDEDEPAPAPTLGGTASIVGVYRIGETLTVDTSGVRGGIGSFSYGWRADDADIGSGGVNYVVQSADVGKAISCVITRAGTTGSVTAPGARVPYSVTVHNIGNAADDTAVTLSADAGQAGERIDLSYTLGNSGSRSNTLKFTGGTGLANLSSAGQSATQNYTVNASDAVNGVISIVATFEHTALTADSIAFAETSQSKTYGDSAFTYSATNTGIGGGAITYSSSDAAIASVDTSSGEVTVLKAGTAVITAAKASDGIYAATTASYTLTIGKKALTPSISFTGVTGKAYDGETTVTGATQPTITLTGAAGADSPAATATFAFADKHVGNSKNITASGISLTGSWGDYYELSAATLTDASGVNITPKALTWNADGTISSKEYDGDTTATVSTTPTLSGAVAGDVVMATAGTATFSDANAGSKTITATGWGIGGADAGNYTATGQPAFADANITPKGLTLNVNSPDKALSPIDTSTTFSATVGGFVADADANSVTLAVSGGDLSVSGHDATGNASSGTKSFTVTVVGTAGGTVSVGVTGNSGNYAYSGGTKDATISYVDGPTAENAIPLTQENVADFITYVGTSEGLSGHYKLSEDIELTEADSWTPIGSRASPFTGSFDGQGHIIDGLVIAASGNDYQGMFGTVGASSIVRDIGLVNVDIAGGEFVGGVAGYNFGTVEGCYVTGSVEGNINTGGVVGENAGTITKCYVTGAVNGSAEVGGIVGKNISTIRNCYATGAVNGTADNIGGIVGYSSNAGVISNCYATGDVEGKNYVAGVVGSNDGIVQYCVALNASITGNAYIARVVGKPGFNTYKNNYARSDLSPSSSNANSENGADVSAGTNDGQYNDQGFWSSTLTWDFTDIWVWDSTNALPVLQRHSGAAGFALMSIPADAFSVAAPETTPVTATVTATEGGLVSINGDAWDTALTAELMVGDTITLDAKSDEGYVFVQWRDENENTVSTERDYSLILDCDIILTAEFAVRDVEQGEAFPEEDISEGEPSEEEIPEAEIPEEEASGDDSSHDPSAGATPEENPQSLPPKDEDDGEEEPSGTGDSADTDATTEEAGGDVDDDPDNSMGSVKPA